MIIDHIVFNLTISYSIRYVTLCPVYRIHRYTHIISLIHNVLQRTVINLRVSSSLKFNIVGRKFKEYLVRLQQRAATPLYRSGSLTGSTGSLD